MTDLMPASAQLVSRLDQAVSAHAMAGPVAVVLGDSLRDLCVLALASIASTSSVHCFSVGDISRARLASSRFGCVLQDVSVLGDDKLNDQIREYSMRKNVTVISGHPFRIEEVVSVFASPTIAGLVNDMSAAVEQRLLGEGLRCLLGKRLLDTYDNELCE